MSLYLFVKNVIVIDKLKVHGDSLKGDKANEKFDCFGEAEQDLCYYWILFRHRLAITCSD
jgi:hypothetical protein